MAISPCAAADTSEQQLRSATEFLSPQLKAEQADLAQNRGMVWVDGGARLWEQATSAETRSCASCHGPIESMKGVAIRYPAVDKASGALVNLEGRINLCRQRHQSQPPLAYESEELLSLTAFLAFQSRGMPMSVTSDGAAKTFVEAGERLFDERHGQLDLACRQCHVENVGRRMRGDVISSGLGTGFPAYRLEWQQLGSLYRRLRACYNGVRAEPPQAGSADHLALELYLAARAKGAPIEAPALRR